MPLRGLFFRMFALISWVAISYQFSPGAFAFEYCESLAAERVQIAIIGGVPFKVYRDAATCQVAPVDNPLSGVDCHGFSDAQDGKHGLCQVGAMKYLVKRDGSSFPAGGCHSIIFNADFTEIECHVGAFVSRYKVEDGKEKAREKYRTVLTRLTSFAVQASTYDTDTPWVTTPVQSVIVSDLSNKVLAIKAADGELWTKAIPHFGNLAR